MQGQLGRLRCGRKPITASTGGRDRGTSAICVRSALRCDAWYLHKRGRRRTVVVQDPDTKLTVLADGQRLLYPAKEYLRKVSDKGGETT